MTNVHYFTDSLDQASKHSLAGRLYFSLSEGSDQGVDWCSRFPKAGLGEFQSASSSRSFTCQVSENSPPSRLLWLLQILDSLCLLTGVIDSSHSSFSIGLLTTWNLAFERETDRQTCRSHIFVSQPLQWHPIPFAMFYTLEVNEQVQFISEMRGLHTSVGSRDGGSLGAMLEAAYPTP